MSEYDDLPVADLLKYRGDKMVALHDDPIVRRWRERVDRGTAYPTSPLDALGVQRTDALDMLIPSVFVHESGGAPDDAPAGLVAVAHSTMVEEAVLYLWRTDMVATAKALPLPRHAVDPKLPHSDMLWVFEEPFYLIRVDDGEETSVHALLVSEAGDKVQTWMIGLHRKGPPRKFIRKGTFRRGQTYPDDFTDDWSPWVVQMLAFLQIPFVDDAPERPPKPRKKSRRGRAPSAEPLVHVVRLRERSYPPEASEDAEPGVRWMHRWIVRGHYRAQWYPSSQTHRLIWISPHEKGPEGLPMKTPVYDVMR